MFYVRYNFKMDRSQNGPSINILITQGKQICSNKNWRNLAASVRLSKIIDHVFMPPCSIMRSTTQCGTYRRNLFPERIKIKLWKLATKKVAFQSWNYHNLLYKLKCIVLMQALTNCSWWKHSLVLLPWSTFVRINKPKHFYWNAVLRMCFEGSVKLPG